MRSDFPNSTEIPRVVPVSVVIPCFNEEEGLPHLAEALDQLRAMLRGEYVPTFIFVDDGSVDRTPQLLQSLFGDNADCQMIRLEANQGIAAALLAGIRRSNAEIVCTIDSDCTYDPCELARMIPLLTADVQVVTASPYHPAGKVLDVPLWRLRLSKTASALYRCVLRQKLSTYTSCFRVYRRSCMAELRISDNRFSGVAEILGRLDLQGAKIVEYPATLRVRRLGRSKMKLFRTIIAQLSVLLRLTWLRWTRPAVTPATEPVAAVSNSGNFQPANANQLTNAEILTIKQGHDHATDN